MLLLVTVRSMAASKVVDPALAADAKTGRHAPHHYLIATQVLCWVWVRVV